MLLIVKRSAGLRRWKYGLAEFIQAIKLISHQPLSCLRSRFSFTRFERHWQKSLLCQLYCANINRIHSFNHALLVLLLNSIFLPLSLSRLHTDMHVCVRAHACFEAREWVTCMHNSLCPSSAPIIHTRGTKMDTLMWVTCKSAQGVEPVPLPQWDCLHVRTGRWAWLVCSITLYLFSCSLTYQQMAVRGSQSELQLSSPLSCPQL